VGKRKKGEEKNREEKQNKGTKQKKREILFIGLNNPMPTGAARPNPIFQRQSACRNH
jgi:hypothetical protein